MARRKYVSSRLVRKESKRMMRQSMVMIVLTIGLLGLLLIWGIPAMVRVAGLLGDVKSSSKPIAGNDTIAPFAPQISIEFEATSSANIDISGFAEAGANVVLLNNGNKVTEQVVGDGGDFTFRNVALNKGENQFTTQAVDFSGNESNLSKVYAVVFDNTKPELEIITPEDGEEFFGSEEKALTVTGTTEKGVTVYVTGRLSFVNNDGKFSQTVSLQEGDNQIDVRAVDRAGNETIASVSVKFKD